MFRHFVVELSAPRARNGVSHKQYSRAMVRLIDGAPYVRHHGRMERLTASVLIECNQIIDVRLASPHLPSWTE
jgi:hypothetical protein